MKLTGETLFRKILYLERRRSERTGLRFALMVIDLESLPRVNAEQMEIIGTALDSATRETDFTGWYQYPSKIAVLFTALGETCSAVLRTSLPEKAQRILSQHLSAAELQALQISLHVFPDDEGGSGRSLIDDGIQSTSSLRDSRQASYTVKRMVDIVGSSAAILVLSPVMIFIAIAIKWTSRGPVFFKQKRVGHMGREFTFLKFRSMIANNDPEIHREFVRRLIAAKNRMGEAYKIQNDPRVTPFGRFLRRTSLDELPQFFNVLKGEMSLVGPRPPIRYELENYSLWHRRRVLEAKPGITGPWQVDGRSRTTFDEMVRMDLKYVRNQSLWLDVKILLKTPFAVFRGQGAY